MHAAGGDRRDGVGEQDAPEIATRPTTAEDVIEFFGRPQRGTLQAISAVMDGRVVGIVGVSREGEIGKYFCDFKPELRPYLKSIVIMRAVKASMEIVRNYRGPVFSVAEHAEGCRILNRLGFTHSYGVIYEWLI